MLNFTSSKQIELRPYQADAVQALREAIRDGDRRLLLVAGTGAGKCLGFDTPILMADGTIKPVQKVVVGDRLASPTGKANTVLSLARGREMMFRVTPTKGDAYTCNASHLLSLKVSGNRAVHTADGQILPCNSEPVVCRADVLYHSTAKAKHCLKGWRSGVEQFEGASGVLPMPPYLFGAWLGGGSKRLDRCEITKPDCATIGEWNWWGLTLGCEVREKDSHGTRGPTWALVTAAGKPNPALISLRNTGVDVETCAIPHKFKCASWDNRADLLAGLLDTDGSVSRGGWDFISKHQSLAEDVAFVARSLGLAAYVSESQKGIKETGFIGNYWRVSISGDASIVPCRTKCPMQRTINKDPLRHGINVQPIGIGDYYGFEITGDRLFMLGDFTVTHNTLTSAHILKEAARKGSYALFIVDRVALVDQTSAVFDEYGIPHGVIQGDHPRYSPHENVQVCSTQTLARRHLPRDPDVIVVDEAHCLYRGTLALLDTFPDAIVIGLTATPFTTGMGKIYKRVVNVIPTQRLIEAGNLVEPIIYIGRAPEDAELTKNSFGEFTEASAAAAGTKIIGDVVMEWIAKTQKHFDGPAKTIVFAPTVDYGRELCASFGAAGFNFQQISYLDRSDDDRAAKIVEFRKPDSIIHGLVSCGVLTKGFDVPDVAVGVSCRPYSKSLSSHMQEIGRVMRPHPDTPVKLWLDHSGNFERFAVDMYDIWENGVGALSDATQREKKARERDPAERIKVTCPECGGALRAGCCTACGWERPPRSDVQNVAGELIQFDRAAMIQPRDGLRAACTQDPLVVWQAALHYTMGATKKGEDAARRWAAGIWSGVYPGAKMPWGWYKMPVAATVAPDALSLVDREVKRFRKSQK